MARRITWLALGLLMASCLVEVAHAQNARANGRRAETPQQLLANWLRRQDANKDGKITLKESSGVMKNNFKRVDQNGDGALDKGELTALAERVLRARPANTDRKQSGRQQTISTEQLRRFVPDTLIVKPDIAYREGGSKAWKLDLVMPKEPSDRPRPGIVFVHGGGWSSGDKRRGIFLNGAIDYAKLGYVCITVNYRLTGEAPLPACIEDVKCAVRWFRAHAKEYNLDPQRIGGYGNSAGAHLVALLGLAGPDADLEGDGPYQDQSSLLQAVCSSATPTDFLLFGERALRTRGRLGGALALADDKLRAGARRVSPITYVDDNAPPFLLIHGTADTTVHVKHSDLFVEALKKAGTDVTYLRIEKGTHGVFNQHRDKTGPAMQAFFSRTLGDPAKR